MYPLDFEIKNILIYLYTIDTSMAQMLLQCLFTVLKYH
jgi:hypothetical protein